MKAVYNEAANLARQNREFVLATVVNTKGSTPQKPGATLLVRADGSTVGTLGGGCVEGDIWFAAKEALREHTGPIFKDYYLNEDIAARDGLVCGGSMFFYIEPFEHSAEVSPLSDEIEQAYEGGDSLAIATVVNAKTLKPDARIVVHEDGTIVGSLGTAEADALAIETANAVMPMGKADHVVTAEGDEIFVAGFTSPATLVLVGGGHVNLQVAKIAQMLGFRVFVTDDRPEFANRERFPMAEDTNVAPYDKGLDAFHITKNTAIVIGSRGHHFDDLATELAVRTPATYVGLLGSKRKTIMIYEALLKRGITPERLKQVHSPVGLDLGGRNPEEIAVSVMAEIIAFRHNRPGGPMKIEEAQIDRLVAKLAAADKTKA
ncbi:MAG: XdhC family protein [Chloroflexi bacterium]|nr:XdhC family protein [Chloroflexota bacterium]